MTSPPYEDALAQGRALYPGVRIGRPGRARTYWATIAAMRVLRVKWSVDVAGSEHVAPGAAILVGNHVSAMDPVVAVMAHWWRVTAFTKVEVYEKRGGIFFRLMGQIPLRRGDNESTAWAMDMATRTLEDGNKVGLYPEGTRSPDGRTMHRLHRRVLLPMLEANPDVAVPRHHHDVPGRRRLPPSRGGAHLPATGHRRPHDGTGRHHGSRPRDADRHRRPRVRRHVRTGGEGRTTAGCGRMITRFAPTPSGYLHLGNAVNAQLIAWLAAAEDGTIALRIDDMDAPRYRSEYVRDIFETLDWLGIAWQLGPTDESDFEAHHSLRRRTERYRAELTAARERGLGLYACRCSRSQLSGPPSGGCPGGCREADHSHVVGETSIRAIVPADVCPEIGDVVLWRTG